MLAKGFKMSFATISSGISDLLNTAGSLFNYGYNKWLQREQWKREDTAIQRRVADLEKAGLSKTLAGSGASSSVVASSAPQVSNSMASAYLDELRLQKDNELKDAQIDSVLADTKNKKKQTALLNSQIASQMLDNYNKSFQMELLSKQKKYLTLASEFDAQTKFLDSFTARENSLLNYDITKFALQNFLDPTSSTARDSFLIDEARRKGSSLSFLRNAAIGVGNILGNSLGTVGQFIK